MAREGVYWRVGGPYKVLFITAAIGAIISRLLRSQMRSAELDVSSDGCSVTHDRPQYGCLPPGRKQPRIFFGPCCGATCVDTRAKASPGLLEHRSLAVCTGEMLARPPNDDTVEQKIANECPQTAAQSTTGIIS